MSGERSPDEECEHKWVPVTVMWMMGYAVVSRDGTAVFGDDLVCLHCHHRGAPS